ncbi:MAG: tryptophan synthase subunit beta [Chlorobi bacterium]|nr:tryptophan synthase subunit beta [Chlorobiota bacterium]
MNDYQVSRTGYYGEFGGAFIPEMLYANIKELQDSYLDMLEDPGFRETYLDLLRDYSGRPTPLFFAKRLSGQYRTNIYLKREDLNHTGAHKINNAIGQALLAKKLGKRRIVAETGAGQHGVATATVCALMDMKCTVYMGAEDIKRQKPNVGRMKMLGAKVIPVYQGNQTLKDAVNEAMRDWISHPAETHYLLGSVVGPHPYPDLVTRLQAIISEELKGQMKEKTGSEDPGTIIACVGGGSNAAGIFYHYLDHPHVRLIGAEAAGKGIHTNKTAATLLTGRPGVLHGSFSSVMQDDDGQITEPYSISAGLDYPGIGPLHAHLHQTGRAEYYAVTDDEALDAALNLSRKEGIIPALESAHALALLDKLDFPPDEHVVINLSGRGDKDLQTLLQHLENEPD